jgi:tetratricopeptide (TPR) repeat protein
MEVQDLALDHDVGAARRVAAASAFPSDAASNPVALYAMLPPLGYFWIDNTIGDWKAALAEISAAANDAEKKDSPLRGYISTFYTPWLAFAHANAGDVSVAAAMIRSTPLDCYICVRIRGDIEAARKNWSGAAYWFSEAVAQGPSFPSAYADWGEMLLHKSDDDAAIAKFRIANQKGPRFADPLEMWGEVLMLKNRSDLALAKFEEANRYTPNWGRLHLKWGEALLWSGNKAEAKKQFGIASHLGLSATHKAALTRVSGMHG